MPDNLTVPHLCCESSLEAGEPLHATASRVDTWLVLECGLPWGAKALPDSRLPPTVKDFLSAQLAVIPKSRFQLIRRNDSEQTEIRFYIAQSSPVNPLLYRFDLSTYEDLLALDILAILSGQADVKPADEQIFLVCTNGRRDACCAQFGVALYANMTAYAGDSAWQTTHLGGHRFAGTMVCLPHGLYYGRVREGDTKAVIDSYRAGQVHLNNFRGRCGFDAPIQAAECFIRQQSGIVEIDSIRLADVEIQSDHSWLVTFESAAKSFSVRIKSYLSEFEVFESTGNAEKSHIIQYSGTTL